MTALPDRVERAFADHGSFEAAEEGVFESTTIPFEGVVRVRGIDPTTVEVTVRAPMLSEAVVDNEEVAPVVETDWFETFDRRMEDAHMPMARERELDPTVEDEAGELVVEATLTDPDPSRLADDARALVEYVEGTYVEGVVPGYEYDDPVDGLLNQARRTWEESSE